MFTDGKEITKKPEDWIPVFTGMTTRKNSYRARGAIELRKDEYKSLNFKAKIAKADEGVPGRYIEEAFRDLQPKFKDL